MEKSEMGKSGEGFIDRSKVRILLCDDDERSSEDIFTLLCACSYEVISVKSPRQVIDALNAQGPDIDIILSEVDLPMSKGLKMLKYIMRDKELRRVPVIMMSAQDEVPLVVKCLKFGAADYLVKPLRKNELLNLWTHMWRRRRMLGLVEKNIVSYDFDTVVSDHSDVNTNSTTLFSDDTDDRSRKSINPERCISTHQEDECNTAAPIATAIGAPSECLPDVPGISDNWTGQMSTFPKKSELRIGESSAFFTYVKSSTCKSINQGSSSFHENTPQHISNMENPVAGAQVDTNIQIQDTRPTLEKHSLADDHPITNNIPESFSMERSSTPISLEISQQMNSNGELNQEFVHSRNYSPGYSHTAYPYYMSGIMNQVTISSIHNHANSTLLPQYNHIPQCPPQVPGMTSYPYYPFGICLQPGQIPAPHPWPLSGNCSSNEGKLSNGGDRREAALMKFRQKRKERCFDKKIRYVNRKKLAERRPRVKGQFVRKVNGINVDLNGQAENDEEEEEEYDEEY